MTGFGSIFNLALIDAYKQCPSLYDCENPEYKVPMPTMQAWEKVSQECGASVIDCRIRWKALRDRYIKERKKNMQSPMSYNRKQWPLYEEMDFLSPFVEKQRRKFHRGTPESMARRINLDSTGRSAYGRRNVSNLFNASNHEEFDCSQDSVNFNEYEDKKPGAHLSTNFQVLQACEVMETPNGNAALDKFLEGIDATATLSTNLDEDDNGVDKHPKTTRKESRGENDIHLHKHLSDFSSQPLLSSLQRKRKFEQNRMESVEGSERNHASLLECLRTSVEGLAKMSQFVLEENEEAIFGRYIATVLSKMPLEKRNRSKLQIFTILHSISDNSLPINENINNADEAGEGN